MAKQPTLLKGEISEVWGKSKWKNLFAEVDISSLVLFRTMFGSIMLWEVYRYISKDWIAKYWLDPEYHFTYWPFDFLSALPGDGMYYLFYALGILALFIILGLFYRVSTILFFIGFSYTFLLEQTRYLNHFYLVILISFLIIFLPLNKAASLDNKIFKDNGSETAPLIYLWLIRFMVGVPYFFGGVAKLSYDWLHGQPLAMWLSDDTDFPIIGQFFTEKWMILFMSYSGLLLDLFVVPALIFKRTRVIGFVLIASFHLMNSQLFSIGIFPWFMICATTLYFSPDWPRKLFNALRPEKKQWVFKLNDNRLVKAPERLNKRQNWIVAGVGFWFLFQTLLPLRHFLIPGNPNWTEEGHRFSWHMKLRTKRAMSRYRVVDVKTQKTIATIDPQDILESWQSRKLGRPYLVHHLCKMIAKRYHDNGIEVEIYPTVIATLNGRTYQDLIRGEVDLVHEKLPVFPPCDWIVHLETPLEDRLDDEPL